MCTHICAYFPSVNLVYQRLMGRHLQAVSVKINLVMSRDIVFRRPLHKFLVNVCTEVLRSGAQALLCDRSCGGSVTQQVVAQLEEAVGQCHANQTTHVLAWQNWHDYAMEKLQLDCHPQSFWDRTHKSLIVKDKAFSCLDSKALSLTIKLRFLHCIVRSVLPFTDHTDTAFTTLITKGLVRVWLHVFRFCDTFYSLCQWLVQKDMWRQCVWSWSVSLPITSPYQVFGHTAHIQHIQRSSWSKLEIMFLVQQQFHGRKQQHAGRGLKLWSPCPPNSHRFCPQWGGCHGFEWYTDIATYVKRWCNTTTLLCTSSMPEYSLNWVQLHFLTVPKAWSWFSRCWMTMYWAMTNLPHISSCVAEWSLPSTYLNLNTVQIWKTPFSPQSYTLRNSSVLHSTLLAWLQKQCQKHSVTTPMKAAHTVGQSRTWSALTSNPDTAFSCCVQQWPCSLTTTTILGSCKYTAPASFMALQRAERHG